PDGGRRDRRTIRRPRRPADAQRAAAPAARRAGARRRAAVCLRSHRQARRHLFDPAAGGRGMRRAAAGLAAALVLLTAAPGHAERVIGSLSSNGVQITSIFNGVELVLFGPVEPDGGSVPRNGTYDIIATVSGPPQTLVVRRKARVFGIWVNVESRTFVDVPS